MLVQSLDCLLVDPEIKCLNERVLWERQSFLKSLLFTTAQAGREAKI